LVRLWLTQAGLALKEPVLETRQALEEKVTAGLSATERRRLLSMLATIHRTASGMLGRPGDHGEAVT
jgi:MarR family transcriptional regulator, organic hydroperoxide resistance regulator